MTTRIDKDGLSRAAQSPLGDWLRISSGMTDATDLIAARPDVVVRIAPGAGKGSKACFHEDSATIEINGDLLSKAVCGRLASVRPLSYDNRSLYPDVWGLLVHECAHAKHTRWKKALWPQILRNEIAPDLLKAAELLEEVRVENAHLDRRSWDTRWLRASAAQHLLGDDVTIEQLSTEHAAARVATLVGGRVSAGVVDHAEVASALEIAESVLGSERSDALRNIVRRALRIKDSDSAGMLKLAREWLDVARISPEPGMNAGYGQGESQDGDASSEKSAALKAALANSAAEVGKNGGRQDAAGKWWGTGESSTLPTQFRKAEPSEKKQAAALTRRLRPYLIPDRSVTRVSQASPPGRLDMTEALTRSAQEAMGLLPDGEPWLHLDRRVLPTPPLRVGISVDVSGSLSDIADHSMRLAYVLTTAFAALPDSRVTTTVFGVDHNLWPAKPGEVPVYDYNSGTAAETAALEDLTARCAFWRRGSARLFIEVGDAEYDYRSMQRHADLYRKLIRAGVRIIFLWQKPSMYTIRRDNSRVKMTLEETIAAFQGGNDTCIKVPGVHVIPISARSSPEAAVESVIDDIVRLLTSGRA